MKQSEKTYYTPKNKHVRDFVRKTVHGGRVAALNRKFVLNSFIQIVNILKEHFGKEHEISTIFERYFRKIDVVKKHFRKKMKTNLMII